MFVDGQPQLMPAFTALVVRESVLSERAIRMNGSVMRIGEAEHSPRTALLDEELFEPNDFLLGEFFQRDNPCSLRSGRIAIDLPAAVEEFDRLYSVGRIPLKR